MKHIVIAKPNPEIIEQLEAAFKNAQFEEPQFTHEEKLIKYIDAMQYDDDSIRENKVITWLTPVLNTFLDNWRSRYKENQRLIERAQDEIRNLENARKQNSQQISEIHTEIQQIEEKIPKKEMEIHDLTRTGYVSHNINLKSELFKVTMLLVFSVVVAMGTFVYFLNAQVAMKWATMDNNSKVGIVQQFIRDGDLAYITQFADVLGVEPGDNPLKITPTQLTAINSYNISRAAVPTIAQYLSYDKSILLLATGALMLILLGKITASVYEKMGEPKWLYYTLYVLAILILLGAITAATSVNSESVKLNQIHNLIGDLEIKIIDFKEDNETCAESEEEDCIEAAELLSLQENLKNHQIQIQTIQSSIGSYKFMQVFLFMLTELLIGSIAWIGFDEYINKYNQKRTGNAGLIDVIKQQINTLKSTHKNLKTKMEELEKSNILITGLLHRGAALLGKIDDNKHINQVVHNYFEREMEYAKQLLQHARRKWST